MVVAVAVVVRWKAGTEGQYRLRTSRRRTITSLLHCDRDTKRPEDVAQLHAALMWKPPPQDATQLIHQSVCGPDVEEGDSRMLHT
ncbi:hypothetical protein O3P69_005372 [Scylla paramamosain]|uniref:Uncharacterized protein n=1 Tax=Scylla paramamosain TaxID=85552 RepID=A0AAW0U8B1_SCYPA